MPKIVDDMPATTQGPSANGDGQARESEQQERLKQQKIDQKRLDYVASCFDSPTQGGDGSWMVCCAAHSDSNPSLHVSLGEEGRILLHCHAGCPIHEILPIVGLTLSNLMPDGWLRVANYDYMDETGNVMYRASRFLTRQGKRFGLYRPDGKGAWAKGIQGIPRVLYRLPALVKADPSQVVFVVEGENKVERLRQLSVLATSTKRFFGL
jgi:hypothetical protein